ncbi:unnamed protein product [Citrullus colocynthis]|uniref:HMA domain-containing protein n=1 Tax=Citrullus colocynthis TaxID=252529 RepID=A0ABP0YDC9_9ROSI
MIPELEKPRITEIKVRMDCNGCVQKIKKALYGINGIYDIYIDFPQQKLTVIGWAEPERIMKAIKKTRKIATICSESEQTDPQAAGSDQPTDNMQPGGGEPPNFSSGQGPPPSHDMAMGGGPPGQSPPPSQMVVQDGTSAPHSDPTNGQQAPQPGSYDPGQGHVTHQPSDHGHVVHQYPSEPGHVVHHQGPGPEYGHVISHQPEHSHVVHHQPPDGHQPLEHSHVINQPPDHSQTVHYHQPPDSSHTAHHHQPPDYSQSHVVHHHQPEHRYTSSHNYHHNIPGATSMQPVTVIHSYNTYKPSPYVTEYVRPLTCSRPPPYASEYIPQQPTTHYSPRMDLYYEDYYNTGTGSSNGNITSIFSDENPNACNLM